MNLPHQEDPFILPHFTLSILAIPSSIIHPEVKNLEIILDSALSLSTSNPSLNATNFAFKTHPNSQHFLLLTVELLAKSPHHNLLPGV